MKKLILTLLVLALTAFITYVGTPRPYIAHHHANFAVYIDGLQRDYSGTIAGLDTWKKSRAAISPSE